MQLVCTSSMPAATMAPTVEIASVKTSLWMKMARMHAPKTTKKPMLSVADRYEKSFRVTKT